jgi:hypothetical protein
MSRQISTICLLCGLICIAANSWGANDKLDIDADFRFGTNSEIVMVDYLFLRSSLEFEFEATKDFECTFEVLADLYELEMTELSFKWKQGKYLNLLFGKFENALTLDEYLPGFDRPFANRNLLSRYIDDQGYVSNHIGVKAYKKQIKGTPFFSYLGHFLLVPSQLEFQFNVGFILHLSGENSYLGIFAAYFPFLVHHLGQGQTNKYPLHNALVDLFWANHSGPMIYALELSGGSNLVDPIGILHFPGSDPSVFLGADAFLGYTVGSKDKAWIPKLRYTILFPDASVMECQQMELRFGNEFRFRDDMKLHADVGLGVDTFYDSGELYTQLKLLWAANFLVSL